MFRMTANLFATRSIRSARKARMQRTRSLLTWSPCASTDSSGTKMVKKRSKTLEMSTMKSSWFVMVFRKALCPSTSPNAMIPGTLSVV